MLKSIDQTPDIVDRENMMRERWQL